MNIYPAVDLLGGQAVRLTQGEVQEVTVYDTDPMHAAKKWVDAGCEWLHVIDIDGAINGNRAHADLIKRMKKELGVKIQVGGGIRDRAAVMDYLESGLDRVILGTSAIENEKFMQAVLTVYGPQIAVALDARDGKLAAHGWRKISKKNAYELATELAALGLETIIYTDIKQDGMLKGPNIAAIEGMARTFGAKRNLIASGGVTTVEDIAALKELELLGVRGIVIGKSLYEGTLAIGDALAAARA